MSIWSTFKTMKVHDSDHSEADPNNCGCSLDDNKVYLSSAWYGFPLRLSIRSGEAHADCTLTREQARELGVELISWAARDDAGEARMYPDSSARKKNQRDDTQTEG
ncbi:hypothetical protein [Nonomuraea sp. NPDC050202]|uniref:hypothetical protein n=1 Tax=Nonomuraea sp. NPDC050202 TaxID=3155035 RepID=UPI0033C37F91